MSIRRPPFLRTAYNAYLHREVPKEDDELTHVGPGTPGGEYLRRFWQPVACSEDLGKRPRAIKVLGEELVVFRDLSGHVGVMELHCPHRGTSLEFGRIEGHGIRCCYHGWLFDVDGRILETPTEPDDSTLKDRLYHGAYPAMEYSGLIFAYMGPPDKRPPFPLYDSYEIDGYRTVALRSDVLDCNWLQIKENVMDPFHTVYLHTLISGPIFGEYKAIAPHIEWRETDIGMISVATRRVKQYIVARVNDFILPNIHQFAADFMASDPDVGKVEPPLETKWAVPVDNTHTLLFRVMRIRESQLDGLSTEAQAQLIDELGVKANLGEATDRPYEERQRAPGDGDAMVSQRPIAIHALEHLGTTDRGVTMVRRLVREGVRAVRDAMEPKGILQEEDRIVATYSQGRYFNVPPADDPTADRKLVEDIGKMVAEAPARGLPFVT